MSIRWITPFLGTAPALGVDPTASYAIVDVRDLVDKDGNRSEAIREKVAQGVSALKAGKKTIVCCDYGISRSNAVAVGVLASFEAISFEAAARKVMEATGEKEIKTGPLHAVRNALQGDDNAKDAGTRILITGGNGFLGKPVATLLSEFAEVIAPSRSILDLNQGSTQLDLLAGEHRINTILHLASPRVYTSNVALGDTLAMLRNVLDVCIARDIRLVFLSSWEVYSGYRSTHLLADEALPLLPKGPYAETKYLCEVMIEHARRTQGLRCLVLRSSPVYGAGSDKPKFIYNFIDKIKRGQSIVTHRYLNGFPGLDLMHIDDILSAIQKAVMSDYCGNLNIGTGTVTTTRDIATMLVGMLGADVQIDSTLIQSDTAAIAMDSSLAEKTLGWESIIDLKHGLSLIINNIGQ